MSYFDTINYKGRRYQTKDLSCAMQEFKVLDNGKLLMTQEGNGSFINEIHWSCAITAANEDSNDASSYVFLLEDGYVTGLRDSNYIRFKKPLFERIFDFIKR